MLDRGVALAPGAYEVLFPGLAHTDAVLDEIVAVAAEAATAVARADTGSVRPPVRPTPRFHSPVSAPKLFAG